MRPLTRRMNWSDWMSKVAGLLLHTHQLDHRDIRPNSDWRRRWKAGLDPEQAARTIAKSYDK